MRISDGLLVGLLLLAGCDSGPVDPRVAAGVAQHSDAAGRIACQPAGAAAFIPDCTVERVATKAGQLLTLRQPDGGFRRLLLPSGGGLPVAADGAEPAIAAVPDAAGLEILIGGDRFRLPVTGARAAPR